MVSASTSREASNKGGTHFISHLLCSAGLAFQEHGIKEDHLSIADDLTIYCKLSSAVELFDKYETAYVDMGSRFKREKK